MVTRLLTKIFMLKKRYDLRSMTIGMVTQRPARSSSAVLRSLLLASLGEPSSEKSSSAREYESYDNGDRSRTGTATRLTAAS